MIKDYKIILMDYDGNILVEYASYVIPAVNDTILYDKDELKHFIVHARHFSVDHLKVVLLGEVEEETKEED